MAIASYLIRREGRYSLQIRYSRSLSHLTGRALYRVSLMTSDYHTAKLRLVECLRWFHKMNNSDDMLLSVQIIDSQDSNFLKLDPHVQDRCLRDLIQNQFGEFVSDAWPLQPERLFARKKFVRWYQSLAERRPDLSWNFILNGRDRGATRRRFEQQNDDAQQYHHERSVVDAFENGRKSILQATAHRVIPESFSHGLAASITPSLVPELSDVGDIAQGNGQPVVSHSAKSSVNANIRVSEALELYLERMRLLRKKEDGLSLMALIIRFFIDEFEDPVIRNISRDDILSLEKMLPEIPNRTGIPKNHRATLSTRYRYAQANGWDGLIRLTEERIRKSYHSSLSIFFGWLIEEGLYLGKKPVFNYVSDENLVSLPRDSFSDDEVIEIISMPLFTGCAGRSRIWKPGDFFIQSHLYWAYILLLVTGLRPGELGQLKLDDFVLRDGIWYLNLRGFDPTKGRVAIKDVVNFKTPGSQRVIPLHPLITDLGILDRIDGLRKIGCPVVFPEWEPYPKPDGEIRWGQPITKSWQYLKTKTKIERKDVTMYSTRHWFADLIDGTDISERARKRLMGHADKNDIPSGYGSKSRMTVRDLGELANANSSTIEAMSDVLLSAKKRAETGELERLEPWLSRVSWSSYYREKIG